MVVKSLEQFRIPFLRPGFLSRDRTKQALLFEIITISYAGPIYYRTKNK